MANGRTPVRIRNQTHKSKGPQWSFRVMRGVAPEQQDLTEQLGYLAEHTREFIDYKNIGKLGVTLLMLDPVLREILDVNPHAKIPAVKLQQLEADVNDAFTSTQNERHDAQLADQFAPYDLYGFKDVYLGLRLADTKTDEQLIADREVIIKSIADTYDAEESKIRRGLVSLRPHITLGKVKWDELDQYQQEDFKKDPSVFMRGYMSRIVHERRAQGFETTPLPIIPSTISLNGLQAFCERRY